MNQFIHNTLQQSIELINAGNLTKAETLLLNTLKLDPNNFDTLHILGVTYGIQNKHNQAIKYLKKAVAIDSKNYSANFNLAKAFLETNDNFNALRYNLIAINIDNSQLDVWINYGKSLQNLKRYDEAISAYERAYSLNPHSVEAIFNKALALKESGNYETALEQYDVAITIKPDFIQAWINKATTLNQLKRYDYAIDCLNQAIKFNPKIPEAWLNKGISLYQSGKYEEAINSYDFALSNLSQYPEALSNKGVALNKLERYEEALNCFDQAISIKPNYYDAILNKGVTLANLNRHKESIEYYKKIPKNTVEFFDASWNRALANLTIGQFREGWKLYDYRWHKKDPLPYRYKQIKELSTLVNIRNKKILIWHEQGYGDTIQFSRFVPKLIQLGAEVHFQVQNELVSVYQEAISCPVFSDINSEVKYDYQVPLLTLPKLFDTDLNNIPDPTVIRPNQSNISFWKSKLNLSQDKLNIGIAVSGSSTHSNDHIRSAPLKIFEPYLSQFNFYLIQKEVRENDRVFLKQSGLGFFPEDIKDFNDTLSIISLMDAIISVDTSLIHLAGSLGKNSHLLLPWCPEWRWLLERRDSPWYKSVTIHRQNNRGQWELSSVINCLNKLVKA